METSLSIKTVIGTHQEWDAKMPVFNETAAERAARLRAEIARYQRELGTVEQDLQRDALSRLEGLRQVVANALAEAESVSTTAGLKFSAAEFVHNLPAVHNDDYWQSSSIYC